MKVIVNACFGGFGLSWEAIQRIAERKGLVASYFEFSPSIRRQLGHQAPDPDNTFVSHVIGPRAVTTYPEGADKDAFVSPSDIVRDDADLVAVVEELGSERASSQLARLAVVEIPDGIEWDIEEYDGTEWVAERHRTWYPGEPSTP
jgi:hypothetical protein